MILKKVMFTIISVILIYSCSKSKPKDNEVIRIGFSVASETFLLERWDRDIKIFMNAARELNAEVIFAKS